MHLIRKINPQEVIADYKDKMGLKKLARKYRTSLSKIHQILKENKIDIRQHPSKQFYKEIIEKYNSGQKVTEIAKEYGISTGPIYAALKEVKKDKKYRLNENFFENIDAEEKAYFFGLICSDGHISKRKYGINIQLSEKDVDILIKMKQHIFISDKEFYYRPPVKFEISNKVCYRKASYTLEIYNKKMHGDLLRHKKTRLKKDFDKIPDIENALIRHFLRGLFDGDGCLSSDFSSVGFCCQKALTKSLKEEIFKHTGIEFAIVPSNLSDKLDYLYIYNKKDCENFLNFLYKDCCIFMKRRYEKYIQYVEFYNRKRTSG